MVANPLQFAQPRTRPSVLHVDMASGALSPLPGAVVKSFTTQLALSNRFMGQARKNVAGLKMDSGLRQVVASRDAVHLLRDSANQGELRRRFRELGLKDAAGIAFARQLEHVYSEVLREEQPVNEALELFFRDNSVPAGARKHVARILRDKGEAAIYRGVTEGVPRVSNESDEEEFHVRHLVTSWGSDIFSEQSANYAGFNEEAEQARTARLIMDQTRNRLFWYGSGVDGLYGMLTYPDMPRVISQVDFSTAAASAILAELKRLAYYAKHRSRAVFAPDSVAFSDRLMAKLAEYRSDQSDKTLLDAFKEQNPHIKNVAQSQELDHVRDYFAALPADYVGCLFYRKDRLGAACVDIQPFAVLPLQREGFGYTTYAYSSIGGVVQRSANSNLLAFLKVPQL